MQILLTGGTGLIGSHLGIELVRAGHSITALTRSGRANDLPFPATCMAWDHKSEISAEKLDPSGAGFDVIIHLAGEPVAQRWTSATKKRIRDSRVISTKALVSSVLNLSRRPATWINASAIGIYGNSVNPKLTEESTPGEGFLVDVCKEWEGALNAIDPSVRQAFVRLGVVLSGEGGALPKMMLPFRYGLGGPIGDGHQCMSWIHLHDVVHSILHVMNTESLKGPVNLVAPNPTTNLEFTAALGRALHKPAFFPVPKLVLSLALGAMSQVITDSASVYPEKLLNSGFQFKFPDLKSALADILTSDIPTGARVLVARQWIIGTPEENFTFFAAAENLERITPPWLNFRITKKSSETMAAGLLIDYKLKIKGLPIRWRTRIENWNPPKEFVDTQLRGPYNLWHHTHKFERLGKGTLMTDRVIYKMHFWPFGDVALPVVSNDVKTIFAYRKKVIEKLFSRTS
jgi:uncharacterized protein (TIGR01777 family)